MNTNKDDRRKILEELEENQRTLINCCIRVTSLHDNRQWTGTD
jgi:hypothetical protein